MATTIETPPEDKSTANAARSDGFAEHLPPALDNSHALARGDQFWHRSAPRRLVAAQSADDPEKAWHQWQRHLDTRKSTKLPAELQAKTDPLLWGLSPLFDREAFADWLREFSRSQKGGDSAEAFLSTWLSGAHADQATRTAAFESLAIAHALPRLSQLIPDTLWWSLCDCLFALAQEAQQSSPDWESEPEQALVHQLLAGELPYVLAFHFSELEPLRSLRKVSHGVFSEAILAMLDGEGLPHCSWLPWSRLLLACWTRARLLADKLNKNCWSAEAQAQYEWLIRQSIRLSRPDGSLVFSDPDAAELSPELFTAALELAGDDTDCAAADALLPGKVVPGGSDFDDDDLPECSVNSEWSALAVMAPRWTKASPRLTLSYGQHPMQIELAAGREVLWSGNWEFELQCDGRPITIADEWDEQCWLSDEDCDFLELVVELENGLRLERQVLFGREDAVLYLADCVLSDDDRQHDFEYRMSFPLTSGVRFDPADETRDGLLVGDKPLAAVVPPGLAEWRADPRGGELVADEQHLAIKQVVRGRQFCCPLFLDLKPRRISKERTWRQLTVADMLEIQPPDVAVGYRLQSGKDQWLVYRSLATPANRTIMGQNLSSEFFAGRFLSTGEIDEFIEIEADNEQ